LKLKSVIAEEFLGLRNVPCIPRFDRTPEGKPSKASWFVNMRNGIL
jgi:hypothetical protein